MRPNGEEVLRGAGAALLTYVLPEVQSAYVRTELTAVYALLNVVAAGWDGAAQRLVDGNAALRALARRGAEALPDAALAGELRALADETDTSVRLSALSEANGRLGAALGRLGVALEGADAPAPRELRAALIDHLRADAEARSLHLMGPRADG